MVTISALGSNSTADQDFNSTEASHGGSGLGCSLTSWQEVPANHSKEVAKLVLHHTVIPYIRLLCPWITDILRSGGL